MHVRHVKKHADSQVPPEQRFFFRDDHGRVVATAESRHGFRHAIVAVPGDGARLPCGPRRFLALGAGRRAVLLQFLLEAAVLSLLGGILGVALGAGIPVYVGLLYDVAVPVSFASVLIAFCVSVTVGLFFGLYPARRAADMNIVDALGYQ